VKLLTKVAFNGVDIALFSAGEQASRAFAPMAVSAGAVVIDNSAEWRMDPDVPLVVPEVNPDAALEHRGIIANPNCSTIQLVVALKPIHDAVGIERINVATYQAVSGAGRSAMNALTAGVEGWMREAKIPASGPEKPVAFNVVPKIDRLMETGYTKEEMKMFWETRKILEDPSIMVNATCVRVPVYYGHSEAVHVETRTKITVPEVQKLLNSAPGITVIDGEQPGDYPTAATDAAHRDAVFVGRIREDLSHPRGIDLWVVSDNVRKGAALNSVQIAEILVNRVM
jgi:aspartate-semialdehyde dehydrogenase